MIADFSSVRIDHLSEADAVSTRLPSLLKEIGHDLLPNESLKAIRLPRHSDVSVYITSDDPDFAQRFCKEFRTSGTSYQHLRAVPVFPKFSPGTITRQTSSKKVLVSWERPTRAVWLHFGTYAEAGAVRARFNRGEYKIGGVSVQVGTPKRYRGIWQILLLDAPFDVTEEQVKDAVQWSSERPIDIHLGKPGTSYDDEFSPALVTYLLNSVGSVDHVGEPRKKGRWWTVAVQFASELDALNAVNELHGKPQEFLARGQLTIRQVCTSKIKVPKRIHAVIRERIGAALATHSQGCKLSCKVFPDPNSDNRFVTLSLQGDDRGEVASLTGEIESMLAGKAIDLSDEVFDGLVNNESAARKMKELQNVHKVSLPWGVVLL